MRVGYARGVRISHSQWHVGFNSIAEWSQDHEVQMNVSHGEDARGVVVHFKARLVAKSCSQVKDVDFSRTCAPAAKYNTIRIILALAAAMGLETY